MKQKIENLQFYLQLIWHTDKGYFVSLFFLIYAMTVLPIVNVFLPKTMIADILKGDVIHLAKDMGILAILSLSAAFLMSFYSIKNSDLFVGMGFRLKEIIQRKKMTMPYVCTEDPEVLNRLESGMTSVDRFVPCLHEKGAAFAANLLLLLLYCFLLGRLQPLLPFLPFMNITMGLWLENKAEKYEIGFREQEAELTRKRNYIFSLMYDYGYGKEIRLFGMKDWLLSIYRRYQREYENLLFRIARKKILAAVGDMGFTFLRELLICFYLIFAFLNGTLSVDEFVLYTGVSAGLTVAGEELVRAAAAFAEGIRHIEHYRSVVEEKYSEVPEENSDRSAELFIRSEKNKGKVEFDKVSFCYPGSNQYILKDFSCTIPAGCHIALVGENGVGKSTFVKLLCGFYKNYEGTIRIDGIDLKEYPVGWQQERVAAVFQESRILPATILENITLQEKCTQEEIQRAIDALHTVGLYEKVNHLPKGIMTAVTRMIEDDGVELSGGEKQKLMICRALYKSGDILLLDEPTTALDALAEHEIYNSFHDITKEKTTLFISHRLNSTWFCDEIWLLKHGRLAERGSHEELYQQKGDYYRLFNMQAKYYQGGGSECEKA